MRIAFENLVKACGPQNAGGQRESICDPVCWQAGFPTEGLHVYYVCVQP